MIRRTTLFVCAVAVAAGVGYAAVSAQSKPAAATPTVSVFKTPT